MMWQEYQKIGSLKGFINYVVNGGGTALQPVPVMRPSSTKAPVNVPPINAPVDLHRPTIRVVPPTVSNPHIPTSRAADVKRPTISVQPTIPSGTTPSTSQTKKSERPTIRVVPPT
jgi:hypothetical protein